MCGKVNSWQSYKLKSNINFKISKGKPLSIDENEVGAALDLMGESTYVAMSSSGFPDNSSYGVTKPAVKHDISI